MRPTKRSSASEAFERLQRRAPVKFIQLSINRLVQIGEVLRVSGHNKVDAIENRKRVRPISGDAGAQGLQPVLATDFIRRLNSAAMHRHNSFAAIHCNDPPG